MFQVVWNTRGYLFWLLLASFLCLTLERILPWRKQKLLRRQFTQDVFWLIFNGHYAGIIIAHVAFFAMAWVLPVIEGARTVSLLSGQPGWLQFLMLFTLKDIMEWTIHILLHRIPWLWEFHKLHHAIEAMDWIGNFRFHWMEIVIYRGLTYFPLVVLGVDDRIILAIAVLSTLIGNLNHSNLNITWGPLRYVINSPRMHIWHHDHDAPSGCDHGVNFGISLSVWDWLFGTAYWPTTDESPRQQPARLGFKGIETFPTGVVARFIYPLTRVRKTDDGSMEFKSDDRPYPRND